jgi:hypothetical protein
MIVVHHLNSPHLQNQTLILLFPSLTCLPRYFNPLVQHGDAISQVCIGLVDITVPFGVLQGGEMLRRYTYPKLSTFNTSRIRTCTNELYKALFVS